MLESKEDKLVNEERGPLSPHLPSVPLSFLPFCFYITHFISPPALILLSHALTLSRLSPQTGPAVHQPPHDSPSCLPSLNTNPNNNTGHRSRERTGCAHNRPVAPTKTIVPYSSVAFLHFIQNWKRQTFEEVAE